MNHKRFMVLLHLDPNSLSPGTDSEASFGGQQTRPEVWSRRISLDALCASGGVEGDERNSGVGLGRA